MKKIFIIQITGKTTGGVWTVNKVLGEEFLKRNYQVEIVSIRNRHLNLDIGKTPLKLTTINEIDEWETKRKKDVIKALKKGYFFKTLKEYVLEQRLLKRDFLKLKEYINNSKPDFIISSHYQVLLGIPANYYDRTFMVQHSSFSLLFEDRNNYHLLKKKEKDLASIVWLSKESLKMATENGFKGKSFIYNPSSVSISKINNVLKNKKITCITRIDDNKRIDLMIKMVNNVFKNKLLKEWKFELYGPGEVNKTSQAIIKNSRQISFYGPTNVQSRILKTSSLNLNASKSEGFSMSIIEAFSYGVPTISFDFGENAYEQIQDGKNGFVIPNDDVLLYEKKLEELLLNPKLLEKMSQNAFKSAQKFDIKIIANEWEKLFKKVGDK